MKAIIYSLFCALFLSGVIVGCSSGKKVKAKSSVSSNADRSYLEKILAKPSLDPGEVKLGEDLISTMTTEEIINVVNKINIQFSFDETSLNVISKEDLDLVKNLLSSDNGQDLSVVVEGHTDAVGTISYNLALGESRAYSAVNYLSNLGLNTGRLSTVSYGEERLLVPTQNRESKNRRVVFKAN